MLIGQNATGKSLVRRALTKFALADGLEVMGISPEGKARGGIVGALVYGTEEYQSTGSNSARTIKRLLSSAQTCKTPHILILDEPDAGLSDDYAAGAGVEISEFCSNLCRETRLVVVSHRRSLVSELERLSPSQLCLGGFPPIAEWLSSRPCAKPLDDLILADREMFRSVGTARSESR